MEEMGVEMLFDRVQRSRRADGKWQVVPYTTAYGTMKLQWHQMLGRRRCSIIYVAQSACGWLTIADAVMSCCQWPSAGLLAGTPARCDGQRKTTTTSRNLIHSGALS